MPKYAEVLAALPGFRNDLMQRQQLEAPGVRSAMIARGAFAAFASPLSNVHATGAGIRQRRGSYDSGEVVLKVFVFDKVDAGALGEKPEKSWQGIPIDYEHLPVQMIRPRKSREREKPRSARRSAVAVEAVAGQRERLRPIVGGLSISPIDVQFVGTLGCFLRRRRVDGEDIFALSNNHVLADTDRLPRGTRIVQPGPEQRAVTPPEDVFATLSGAIPIRFPTSPESPVLNRFDAAIALVPDPTPDLIARGTMFEEVQYDPHRVVAPTPGMRVVKVGRTTGVTRGVITATDVDGVQVNYGTRQMPRIAVFENTVEVATLSGDPFSLPGDSGSVILEELTGHPVALLFAGDGRTTTACELGPLCRRLRAWPV